MKTDKPVPVACFCKKATARFLVYERSGHVTAACRRCVSVMREMARHLPNVTYASARFEEIGS